MFDSAENNKLRILHLISSERWTGAAEPVASLAQWQERLGHEVYAGCVPGASLAEQLSLRNIRRVEALRLNRRLHPIALVRDWLALPRFCRERGIDVVHCHLLHDHWLAALSLRRLRKGRPRRPVLFRTQHRDEAPRNDLFHRWLFLKASDAVVCVSERTARQIEQSLRLSPGSIPFVSGAVDLDRFRPGLDGSEIRGSLGIPDDAPAAGLVARMRAGRGIRWLMEAVPEVLRRVPEARIFLVGRGELKKWFKEEIRKPIYRNQVLYAGYRFEDLPQTYAAMDTALFLGLGNEGTCRAILEAGACGVPTIGAHIGPVPEIIEDGQTGLLARERDTAHLADRLVEALSDRARCREMGRAARRRVEQFCKEEDRARAFLNLYHRALSSGDALRGRSGT